MKLKDIVRANKDVTDWGKWEIGGKMPRTAFPLSRPRNRFYRLGSYRWRVVKFTAIDQVFRLLIAYHPDKEQYRAILAMSDDNDSAVLAQYEFHGTHPGWHVLVACDDVADAPRGAMRNPWQIRFPKGKEFHRSLEFDISSDYHALTKAVEFFRLNNKEGILL